MMCSRPFLTVVAAGLGILAGCATRPGLRVERQVGESVILVGEEPAALAHAPARGEPVIVRSTYLNESGTIYYTEGRDYTLDRKTGTLHRTANSRLPNFRKNILFGRENFDHSQAPGFGNGGYFTFVDYAYEPAAPWPVQATQAHFLPATRARLEAGRPVKIVAFGDSITAGGDATKPELIFWRRWADDLQRRHPGAKVTAVNGATIGDSTAQGLQRLQAKVLDEKPDLVLVGFGMNDHNVIGVPIPQFEANLKELIARTRSAIAAEVVLLSAFPPNPKWKFGTHRMEEYAAATARVARETRCAFADVFGNWQTLAARKKPEDLLGNNINHPNDFGHWIYFRVLQEIGL
jgi:lysophospholipase L1-like esterase